MEKVKENRTAYILLFVGILSFVLMICTSFIAFGQVASDTPDENVVKVDPNIRATSVSGELQADSGNIDPHTGVEVVVFSTEYKDSTGKEIVVKSQDGEKVVAPGAEDNGTFSVKNTSNDKIRCTCDFFGENKENVPVFVKLQDNSGTYILGSGNDYVSPLELNNATRTYEMIPGEVVTFSLPWRWMFETPDKDGDITEGDRIDTDLGNRAVNEDIIVVKVGVKTTCEVIPEGGDGPSGEAAQTGNYLMVLFGVLAVILIASGWALFSNKKRKKEAAAKAANNKN